VRTHASSVRSAAKKTRGSAFIGLPYALRASGLIRP
jgi:hypothetical protein